MVHPREAQRAVSAWRTKALEPIHFVHTSAPTHARIRGTLVYLHIAFNTCVSWSADTCVLIDAVDTLSILTRIVCTIIFINLTVYSCSAWGTVTLVSIDQVNATPSVLAGVTVALLHLNVTDGASISRGTFTGEGGNAIFAHAVMARRWFTVIDVLLTEHSSKAFCTFTVISIWSVNAFSPI